MYVYIERACTPENILKKCVLSEDFFFWHYYLLGEIRVVIDEIFSVDFKQKLNMCILIFVYWCWYIHCLRANYNIDRSGVRV